MKKKYLLQLITLFAWLSLSSQTFETQTFPRPLFTTNNIEYGYRIAVDGDIAVVGAQNGELAEVLQNVAGTWTRIAILKASNRIAADCFGQAVAINGDVIIVGAYQYDTAGAAYVFEKPVTGWKDMTETMIIHQDDPRVNDCFGYSVAVHGNTLAVGAPMKRVDGLAGRGAGYVFEKQGATWVQKAKLTENSGVAWHRLGSAVVMNSDTIILGAEYYGEVYVYNKPVSGWADMKESQQLFFSDYVSGDREGSALSMSNGVLVVGAYRDEDATGGVAAGSAYVFENIAGTWTEKCKLLASDRAANDFFGFAVSIQNNVICIGAHAEDNNTKFQNGSAYIFEKVAGTWTEKSKITSSKLEHNIYFGRAVAVCGNDILSGCKEDLTSSIGSVYVKRKSASDWSSSTEAQIVLPKGANNNINYHYGYAVSIDKNTAVIGSPGANSDKGHAYVVEKKNGSWDTVAVLTGSDLGTSANFGASVAISGDYIAVGAPYYSNGAVYIFKKPVSGWTDMTQTVKLVAGASAQFGRAVAMSDTTLLIGDPSYNSWTGQTFVYQCINGTWTSKGKLTSASVVMNDAFGNYTAIDHGIACVSASGITNNERAIVFKYNGTAWIETDTLKDGDAIDNDLFGNNISISNGIICIGARQADVGANANQGAAYIFEPVAGKYQLVKKITSSDGFANDGFGTIGIAGDIVVVGAYNHGTTDKGTLYFFKKNMGVWNANETSKVTYPKSVSLGATVAIYGGTIVSGSSSDKTLGSEAGCAYFYKIKEAPTSITLSKNNINETQALNTNTISLTASDINADETFTFSLAAGNGTNDADNNKFAVSGNNLQLTSGLNYENKNTASIYLKVMDSEGLSFNSAFTVVVNNIAPALQTATVSCNENSSNGTAVTKVNNTGDTTSITWSITSGNTNNAFIINSSTGSISVNTSSELDFETTTFYTLIVKADDGVNNSSQTITVNISNLNDIAPVVQAFNFTIDENLANAGNVGTIVASDADNLAALSYSISAGNTNNAFVIDVATGKITVNTSSELDYETTRHYSITVEVSDGLNKGSKQGTIQLNNLNDSKPIVNAGSFSIAENPANGLSVGTVLANDLDTLLALTYSITTGILKNSFSINPASGLITVADSIGLDYESIKTTTIKVKVSDGTNSDSATITINLTNINDNKPETTDSVNTTINEECAAATTVHAVIATDKDGDDLTYTIKSGNKGNTFAIHSTTGLLSTAGHIDFETDSIYTLTIEINDGKNSVESIITIKVKDLIETGLTFSHSDFFSVFPNPASHEIYLHGANGIIRIFNTEGKLLTEISNYTEHQAIDVSGLASGLYLIQTSDHSCTFVKK